MAKRRNPPDLTGRNNRARKAEITALRLRVKTLETRVRTLEREAKGLWGLVLAKPAPLAGDL